MRTLDVGVDMDGCVYNFTAALRCWVHLSTGRPFDTLPDPVTWTGYVDQWGLSPDEFRTCFRDAINAGIMFRHGIAYPGAIEALWDLRAAGHRLHIVTDRLLPGAEDAAVANTKAWLAEHNVPFDTLRFGHDKTAVAMDCFIEDRPENHDALAGAGGYPVLMDRPYNASHPARRVRDWAEFVAVVDALARSAEAA